MKNIFKVVGLSLALFLSLFLPLTAQAEELTGTDAVAFSLPGENKQTITLNDYRGKVVLVDFWASWCTPCIRSFPWMNKMLADYGDKGLEVIAINMDQEKILADKFLQRYPNKLTIAFDPEGKVAEQYNLLGLPTSYLVDRNGKIVYRHLGFRLRDADDYEGKIKQILVQ